MIEQPLTRLMNQLGRATLKLIFRLLHRGALTTAQSHRELAQLFKTSRHAPRERGLRVELTRLPDLKRATRERLTRRRQEVFKRLIKTALILVSA